MEPLGNTSIDSKILGRNHNKGMMIELRLRTDDYDGYRPYDMVSLKSDFEDPEWLPSSLSMERGSVGYGGLGMGLTMEIGFGDGLPRACT